MYFYPRDVPYWVVSNQGGLLTSKLQPKGTPYGGVPPQTVTLLGSSIPGFLTGEVSTLENWATSKEEGRCFEISKN